MMQGPRAQAVALTIDSLGGAIVNPLLSLHAAAFLVGSALIVVELAEDGEACKGCEDGKRYIENAGGKWIRIEPDCADISAAVRHGIHYSTAQTRSNLDATIDLWCDHADVALNHRQSEMLINLLSPRGAATC